MSRQLALRVERLEALVQLALARSAGGGGGSSEPVLGIIYRQGGVSGGNVLATWAEVKTAIANARGVVRVYVDSSITSPSLVATGDVTDCLGNVELWPYRKNVAVRDTLLVKDGSTLHRIRGVFGPMTLQLENKTVAGLTFNNGDEIVLRGDSSGATSIIEGLAGSTIAPVDLHAAATLVVVEATFASLESDQVGIPFFALGAVSSAIVTASQVIYQGLVVTGAPGSTLEIGNLDTSTQFPPASALAGFTGTLLESIVALAPGTTPYNAPWYAAGTIFIDPAAGNDSNAGTTVGTPIKTWAEAVRRWGTVAPILNVTTTVTFLSSHVDNSDPVVWRPIYTAGSVPTIQGKAATVTTATVFTRSAQKSRVAGANSLLAGSFAAGAPAQGVFVQNTTAGKASRAWVYKTAGGANWNMSQPMAPQTPPLGNGSGPAEVDTWASLDTVDLLGQVAVNIVDFSPTLADFNGGFTNVGQVYNLIVFDPSGIGVDPIYTNNVVTFTECAIQRYVTASAPDPFAGCTFQNCALLGGYFATDSITVLFGGFLLTTLNAVGGSFQADGDAILGAAGNLFAANHLFGLVYLDATQTLQTGALLYQSLFYGAHVVYGSAGSNINHSNATHGSLRSGTYTAGWTAPALVATGAQLNGASTGNSVAYAANVGTIHNGIATTVANLDAGAGPAGFGGIAFNLGGASISNSQ